MPFTDETRYKTVQAPSLSLLEVEVAKWEKAGWLRKGEMALAKPVSDTKPPYWVQSMSRAPFQGTGNGSAKTGP